MTTPPEDFKNDAFICHASEDKKDIVEPLAKELHRLGARVWFDKWSLEIGDSLRQKIDDGLVHSKYGIVVLSKFFFAKRWPQYELDGLVQREMNGTKVILPVWHDVNETDVISYSPTLAGRIAGKSADGIEQLAGQLMNVMQLGVGAPVEGVLRERCAIGADGGCLEAVAGNACEVEEQRCGHQASDVCKSTAVFERGYAASKRPRRHRSVEGSIAKRGLQFKVSRSKNAIDFGRHAAIILCRER